MVVTSPKLTLMATLKYDKTKWSGVFISIRTPRLICQVVKCSGVFKNIQIHSYFCNTLCPLCIIFWQTFLYHFLNVMMLFFFSEKKKKKKRKKRALCTVVVDQK